MTKSKTQTKELMDVINEVTKEEIHAVRVYQSISFDKKNETYFSTSPASKKAVNIAFHDTLQAIKIQSDNDSVIVPLTNVSAIYLRSKLKEQNIKEAQQEQKKLSEIAKSKKDSVKRPQ